MDGITIPAEQVVPLDTVAPGVHGLRIAFVNVFGVTLEDGTWTLIDAAIPFSAGTIRSWAEKHFLGAPQAIVLTHGHFDHCSAAGELASHWNVPVYAHPLEFPYLTGRLEYAPPNIGAGGGIMPLLSPLFPKKPIDISDRLQPLAEEGSPVSVMPGWQLLHTPGHTPGHVSFFRPADRTLLVGDAFCTTKAESFFEASFAQTPELHGPPAYFTSDWNAARASVERLALLEAAIVAPGHGKPLQGPAVAGELRQLAARFDEVAVPDNVKEKAPTTPA